MYTKVNLDMNASLLVAELIGGRIISIIIGLFLPLFQWLPVCVCIDRQIDRYLMNTPLIHVFFLSWLGPCNPVENKADVKTNKHMNVIIDRKLLV